MEIQFIYNAKNGLANSIFDLAHKIVSPETYQCNLCKITHGAFTETKKFKEPKQKYNITLWYIDEYEAKYKKETSYQLVIIRNQSGKEINRLDSKTINNINTVNELEQIIFRLGKEFSYSSKI